MEIYISTAGVSNGARERTRNARLAEFTRKIATTLRLKGDVHILLTGNDGMRALNERFRGKSKSTDVISFPAPKESRMVGDIALSVDIAGRNARALGHSLDDELKVLVLHGMLHLAGFDHETDAGEMESKERALRTKWELPISLIARATAPTKHRKVTMNVRSRGGALRLKAGRTKEGIPKKDGPSKSGSKMSNGTSRSRKPE